MPQVYMRARPTSRSAVPPSVTAGGRSAASPWSVGIWIIAPSLLRPGQRFWPDCEATLGHLPVSFWAGTALAGGSVSPGLPSPTGGIHRDRNATRHCGARRLWEVLATADGGPAVFGRDPPACRSSTLS